MVITDPGIKVDHGYKPYDSGISEGVFVKVCMYMWPDLRKPGIIAYVEIFNTKPL